MRKLILVVEDSPTVLKLCAEALTRSGYDTRTATDGRQAVELARDLRPDLVVMDVHLPGIDGLKAAYLLRSASDTYDIPILAMTGSSADELHDEALGLGCAGILQKPFTVNALIQAVDQVLALHRAQVA